MIIERIFQEIKKTFQFSQKKFRFLKQEDHPSAGSPAYMKKTYYVVIGSSEYINIF